MINRGMTIVLGMATVLSAGFAVAHASGTFYLLPVGLIVGGVLGQRVKIVRRVR